jgi:hypothetical protein
MALWATPEDERVTLDRSMVALIIGPFTSVCVTPTNANT